MGNKYNKILHIVRIRQMLRRWRMTAHAVARAPSDVPEGHVAVVVGPMRRRYVVRAMLLNHPVLEGLLIRAEEEYGFSLPGPLAIPCDELLFEAAIRLAVSQSEELQSGSCHVGVMRRDVEFESRPLLNEI